MKKSRTRDICYIAVFTAIIAIVSQISIPMPAGVPMTMQTFIIPLAAIVLGTKKGTISTVVYVLLGLVGAPVFAGFVGGVEIVFGMTGGFIISFPILALCTGIGYELATRIGKDKSKGRFYAILTMGVIVGTVINYVFGTVWFSAMTKNSFAYSFAVCVVPFILTTILKIVFVVILGPMLKGIMIKAGALEVSTR